jgi:hypothetical protein
VPSPGKPISLRIDPDLYNDLRSLVSRKRQRHGDTSVTITGEIDAALRRHLTTGVSELEGEILAPVIANVLEQRVERLEFRLAGLLAKTGLDSATSLYLLLYTLAETNKLIEAVQPGGAQMVDVADWYARARQRAIRHFKEREPGLLQRLEEPPTG